MRNLFCGIGLGAALMAATPALADDQFFAWDGGAWSVLGGTADGDAFCSASTHWPDGSSVILILPQGDDGIGMIVTNTDWFITSPEGTDFSVKAIFKNRRGQTDVYSGTATVSDPQTVIFAGLTAKFVEAWAVNASLYLDMPGDLQDLPMTLTGTMGAIQALASCAGEFPSEKKGVGL